jgi:predicted RNA polymerase sigma factor
VFCAAVGVQQRSGEATATIAQGLGSAAAGGEIPITAWRLWRRCFWRALLAELTPDKPEALGLLALMLHAEARRS